MKMTKTEVDRMRGLRMFKFCEMHPSEVRNVFYNSTYQTVSITAPILSTGREETRAFGITADGLKAFLMMVDEYRELARMEDNERLVNVINAIP